MTNPLGEDWEPEPLPRPASGLICSGPLQEYFRQQQLAYATYLAEVAVIPAIHEQIEAHIAGQVRRLAEGIGPIPITLPAALIKQLGPLGRRAVIAALEANESELQVAGLELSHEPEQDLCFNLYPPGAALPEEPTQGHWVPNAVVRQATSAS